MLTSEPPEYTRTTAQVARQIVPGDGERATGASEQSADTFREEGSDMPLAST